MNIPASAITFQVATISRKGKKLYSFSFRVAPGHIPFPNAIGDVTIQFTSETGGKRVAKVREIFILQPDGSHYMSVSSVAWVAKKREIVSIENIKSR